MISQLPRDLQDICQALRTGLERALGDKLYGIYVYGAVAFPGSGPTGDIDFYVILTEALTCKEHGQIDALHNAIANHFPPLGAEPDGRYILLDEARQPSPPVHQLQPDISDDSWALHREHMRAGRCIVLHGPDPKRIFPPATWPELESALRGELKYVEDHLDDYPDYCILNLFRLMYSFETRDAVVSKSAAAAWAYQHFPRWRRHIELAKRSYAREATMADRQFMLSEVKGLFRFSCERIENIQTGADH
jgi:hypothetical protein